MMKHDTFYYVVVLDWLIPVCLVIILILRKECTYRRALMGGAIAGAAWRIPAYILTLMSWKMRISTDGAGLPPLSDFVGVAIEGAVLGTVIVSVWKVAELILRKIRSFGRAPQP